jgi:hypothetical protein
MEKNKGKKTAPSYMSKTKSGFSINIPSLLAQIPLIFQFSSQLEFLFNYLIS